MSLSSAQKMMVQTQQTRVDCISHLLSRCLAILIAPSERLRSDVIKTSMSCSAGEETPSHLSHVKIPVQFTCSQCSGSECPFLAGGERLLLTQGDKVMCAQDLDWAAHRLSTCKKLLQFCWPVAQHTSLYSSCVQGCLKQSQDMLSPAEKAQGNALLMLDLCLPVLSLMKTFPVRDKLVNR